MVVEELLDELLELELLELELLELEPPPTTSNAASSATELPVAQKPKFTLLPGAIEEL